MNYQRRRWRNLSIWIAYLAVVCHILITGWMLYEYMLTPRISDWTHWSAVACIGTIIIFGLSNLYPEFAYKKSVRRQTYYSTSLILIRFLLMVWGICYAIIFNSDFLFVMINIMMNNTIVRYEPLVLRIIIFSLIFGIIYLWMVNQKNKKSDQLEKIKPS